MCDLDVSHATLKWYTNYILLSTIGYLHLPFYILTVCHKYPILDSTLHYKSLSYTTVVLYIRDHGDLGFPSQKITQKPASQYHPGTLAVLVRYNQTQKCLQYDPKGFQ